MNKEQLIEVYRKVCRDIKAGSYINGSGEQVSFRKTSKLKSGTMIYTPETEILEISRPEFAETKIYTENIDSFEKAIQLGSIGTAVLNMASYRNPGGGVANGSRAQEEELCRRSNLLLSLYGVQGNSMLGWNSRDYDYPIPVYGTIYTPYVNIYRAPKTYEKLDYPILTNVISASMVIKPSLTNDGRIEKKYVHIIKKKIRSVFRTAILTENTKLVLGAWGCGAYGCPSKHMAELFRIVLDEPEFKKSFEEICFAILEDHNSVRYDNPDGNFKPFKDIFG